MKGHRAETGKNPIIKAASRGAALPSGAGETRAASGSNLNLEDYIIMGALNVLALLLILIFAVA